METVQYITEKQLAEMLSCHIKTVRNYRYKGMPAHCLGGMIRYEFEQAIHWLKEYGKTTNRNVGN